MPNDIGEGRVRDVASEGPHVAARVAVWSRVDRSAGPEECWPWRGPVSGKGYGYHRGKRAHRLAYEDVVGPIPEGQVIDHLCGERLCCNPAHLEAVSNRTNVLRGDHPNAVTHRTGRCRRGHSMRDAKVTKKGRECRKCIRMRNRRYRQEAQR